MQAQSAWVPDGSIIQAESVTLAASRALVRGMRTESFTPSKLRPLPACPAVKTGPFWSVPVLLFPEESEIVVPPVDSNCQYASRPDWKGSGVGVVVKTKSPLVTKLPEGSRDNTR